MARRKKLRSHRLPPPGVGIRSRSNGLYTAFRGNPSAPTMRKMRLTTRIFSSSTSSPSRAALSLKPYFTRCPAMTFPSRALRSLPRLLRSAILARSYLPSWSSMPSVSSPSGDSSPRSLSAYLRPVLLELALEQVVVGGLAGEAVAVLRQHHRNSALGHEVVHPVHAGALQARPAPAPGPHPPRD